MTLAAWRAVPLPVWIMFGLLVIGWGFLAVSYGRLQHLSGKHKKLYKHVVDMDDDLATAEADIKKLKEGHRLVVGQVRDLKDSCDQLTREPVRPAVPMTAVIDQPQTGGRHSALRPLPPLPYGERK